ncbi:ABC transporter permease [Alcaligenes sp. A-TC2]|uniref:cell division protein FtsX n=1 Tax=Alcaligenes nematophilus TaxID=2994643 RepID=UPI0022590FE4|nr:ABC transporter permease [Alcaligenes nematophilus]MCX5471806.1 ABC transporter permease [Alcaligenes nematophilus]
MRTWLRHHQYAFLVALRRLKVQPFSSLSNLLVIALTLAVPVLGASILLAAQPVVREIPTSPEMTVFMKQNSTLEQAQAFSQAVGKEFQAELAQIRLVSKEQALKQLQSNPSWTDALGALPSNPLPHAIVLTLHETPDLVTRADTLAKTLQDREGVDSVLLDSEWVQRLAAILSFIRIGLWILMAGVGVVVIATVFNTVRLQALNQREEIAVARLVGATEAFVRRPFLYMGALTGLTASALACGLALLALTPLNKALSSLAQSYGVQLTLRLPEFSLLLTAAILVAILGALAARWSVTRSTQY